MLQILVVCTEGLYKTCIFVNVCVPTDVNMTRGESGIKDNFVQWIVWSSSFRKLQD
jgi:hypothetical protein